MQNRGVTLDESILEAIRETRRNLGQARHLPGFLYTAPEIFDYEVETIFMKEWLCVGRVEEFENEGDYRAMRIAGEPLLVCRDASGALNAFHNVCRHRASRSRPAKGRARASVAPITPGSTTWRASCSARRTRRRSRASTSHRARCRGSIWIRGAATSSSTSTPTARASPTIWTRTGSGSSRRSCSRRTRGHRTSTSSTCRAIGSSSPRT